MRALHNAAKSQQQHELPKNITHPPSVVRADSVPADLLQNCRIRFETLYIPQIENFVQYPPTDKERCSLAHERLTIAIKRDINRRIMEVSGSGVNKGDVEALKAQILSDVQGNIARLDQALQTVHPDLLKGDFQSEASTAGASVNVNVLTSREPNGIATSNIRQPSEVSMPRDTATSRGPVVVNLGYNSNSEMSTNDRNQLTNPQISTAIGRDQARFTAHARLVADILTLIDQQKDSVKRKIRNDMHDGTLALHYHFWTRYGRKYCFDHLVPTIIDCEEVVSPRCLMFEEVCHNLSFSSSIGWTRMRNCTLHSLVG